MTEYLEFAFSGVNIAYTTLLILILVYWSIVILGLIDLDAFDLDLDVDAGGFDADADFDADVAAEGAAEGSAGGFSFLAFFNVGEVPIMFFVSIVVLAMWIVSMQINGWLDAVQIDGVQQNRGWIAAALAIPNFIFALFVAKFVVLPLKRLRREHKPVTEHDGKPCLVKSLEVTEKYGQVEIPTDESPLLLNARTEHGEVLHKNDAAQIVRHVFGNEDNYYLVTKLRE